MIKLKKNMVKHIKGKCFENNVIFLKMLIIKYFSAVWKYITQIRSEKDECRLLEYFRTERVVNLKVYEGISFF